LVPEPLHSNNQLTGQFNFQIPSTKIQTNSNNQNSKSQTLEARSPMGPVLVIDFLNLSFICNLVLGIWDLNFIKAYTITGKNNLDGSPVEDP
jgi:hypothetical protein